MEIRIVLDYYHPWPNSIGFHEARRKGLVGKLQMVFMDPFYGDSLDSLLSGMADVAISYPNRTIDRICRGADFIALFPLSREPFESLFYEGPKKNNIFEELSGKKVGYRKSPRLKALLENINKEHFQNKKPLELVEFYPQEPMPENLGKEIDFCFGALYVWEGLFSHGKEISYHRFPELGIPSYPGQIVVTTKEFFDKNQERLEDWCLGIKAGYESAYANPQESLDSFYELIPYFPKATVQKSFELLKDYIPMNESWGLWNFQALEEYQNFLLTYQLIPSKVSLQNYFWNGT